MEWLTVIKFVISFVAGLVPSIMGLIAAIKKWRKTKAENDLLAVVNQFISTAETTFAELDAVMKAQGTSAGAVKKETVMTKLQAYALQKGYKINLEEWSAKIDEIVAFTKSVNGGKTA